MEKKIKSASDAIIPVYVPAFALIGFCYLCIANPFLDFSPVCTQNSERDKICVLDTCFCLTSYFFSAKSCPNLQICIHQID